MPWPSFLQPLGNGLRKVGTGIRHIEDDVAGLMRGQTPGINGEMPARTLPPPTAQPMTRTAGAGNLTQAAGIHDETRAGKLSSAMGVPDTDGGVLMPPRPATQGAEVGGQRLVLQNNGIPGGEPPAPAAVTRELAAPAKSYGHRRLDYTDEHGKRSFGEAMKSGLYGGLMGMANGGGLGGFVGGFGAGALGQTIAPQQMARARFEMGPGRQMLADQARDREQTMADLKVQRMGADLDTELLQAENYRGMISDRAADNQRQAQELEYRRPYYEAQAKAELAQAKLRAAQEEAARRGTPARVDIEDADGKINTYNVYPNGDRELIGASARAAYERQQNATSRANTKDRVAASERNTARRLNAPGKQAKPNKYTSRDEVDAYARDRGISYEEALTNLMNLGYKLTPKN